MKTWILTALLGLAGSALPVAAAAGADTDSAKAEAAKPAAHETLVRAVREKRVLRFVYSGHVRVVEPYAYGVTATGEVVLHAFQTEGGSTSRPPPGWRTFSLALIEDLVATEEKFKELRADYVPGEPALTTVWAAQVVAVE